MTVTTEVKQYSLSEVSLRNGRDSKECWIVYKDAVYDCTNYLDDHPGGGELILEYGGKDSTKAFNDAGHSIDAMKDLKALKIGELIDEDKKANRGKSKESKGEKMSFGEQVKQKKKLGGFLFC